MAKKGRAVSGAVSGASSGAALGSAIPGIGTAIGAGVGGLAGLLGGLFSGGGQSEEEKAADEYRKQLEALGLPPEEAYKVALQKYQYLGDITPELENIVTTPDTELKGISTDPELRRQQLQALAQTEAQSKTGLTDSDRADINNIGSSIAQQQRSARESALQRLAARGTLDSGMALASETAGQQEAAAQSAALGAELAKQAMARKTAATENLLKGASSVRDQDYAAAQNAASAQDVINKFRTSNAQGVYGANTNRVNSAAASNMERKQGIANSNTEIANKESAQLALAARQKYKDQADRLTSLYGADSDAAKAAREEEQRRDQSFAGIMKGVGDVANVTSGIIKDNSGKKIAKKAGVV